MDQLSKIPPFILQPFIENSIQHGLRAKQEGGKLKLHFVMEKSWLKVEITDNGMGYLKSVESKSKESKHKSLGIQTINERLKVYNGKELNESVKIVDLSSLGQEGTQVTVVLKLIK